MTSGHNFRILQASAHTCAGGARGRAGDPPRRHIRSRSAPHNGVAGRACGMAHPPAECGGQTCHGRPVQWACRRARPGALAPHNIDPENAAHAMRAGRSKRRPRPATRGSLPFQSGMWSGAGQKYGTPPRSHTFPMMPFPDVSEGGCAIRTGAPEEQGRCAAYAPRPHMAHAPQTDGGLQILWHRGWRPPPQFPRGPSCRTDMWHIWDAASGDGLPHTARGPERARRTDSSATRWCRRPMIQHTTRRRAAPA